MTPTMPAAPLVPTAAPAALPVVIQTGRGEVRIPPGIVDLATFRQWLRSDDFPEKLRICYFDGVLWVDLSMEQLYTHNQVKLAVTLVVGALVESANLGRYVPDGMHLSHVAANLSTVPDGLFVSYDALQTGRVQRVPTTRQVGVIELAGTPDMVLEVVSESSVEKDMVTLPALYQAAGIPEFWRIDVRDELRFEILRLTPTGYAHTQLADDWWHSDVFNRDFRLAQRSDPLGAPKFVLEMR